MERSKKIIFVSYCILNQNSVVYPLARANGPYSDIITELLNSGSGIHQLPCPEFRFLGLKRNPMTKYEYNIDDFRKINKKLALDTAGVMKEYINNGYEI